MSAPAATTAPPGAPPPVRRLRLGAVVVAAVAAAVALGAVHLTQGTADLGPGDLWRMLLGQQVDGAGAVLVASRVPRLVAGVLVGVCLGVAGTILQSVARNALASPDTMAVNAGAYLAVAVVAAFGVAVPIALTGAVALVGGLGGAALVLVLARGGAAGPARLILAGATTSLALAALTTLLLILFEQETTGLYAWGNGSIVQSGTRVVTAMAPVVAVGVGAALLVARRLDLLALGDDAATVLGVDVVRTRVVSVVVAVLLSATAVTIAGPIGFVGLCAPALVRLLTPFLPGLQRHRVLMPLAALAGVLVVLAADVLLRLVLGGAGGVQVPTGVVTSLFGASVLVLLARRLRDSGPTRRAGAAGAGRPRTWRFVGVLATCLLVALGGAMLAGLLLGDRLLLTGDVLNWLTGDAVRVISASLTERAPRVLAAVLAGAALALAGAVVQAVCRNPLAEPGLLGITSGAGVGAVAVLAAAPLAGVWAVAGAAGAGALLAFAIVYALSCRGGLDSDRLVLVGIGVGAVAQAITAALVILSNPWDVAFALTWLSGSTYGRIWAQLVPIAVALAVVTPLVVVLRHRLDVVRIDDDVPRVLGIPLERTRLLLLAGAALLASAAVSAIGVVGFVGLVAPHAARALVGARHAHVVPVSMLLGALLVSVADTIGRTVISPAQIPAGLITALVGAPYFLYLLWRLRERERA